MKHFAFRGVTIAVSDTASLKEIVNTMRSKYNGNSLRPEVIMIEQMELITEEEYNTPPSELDSWDGDDFQLG